jgi:hypothetical protein
MDAAHELLISFAIASGSEAGGGGPIALPVQFLMPKDDVISTRFNGGSVSRTRVEQNADGVSLLLGLAYTGASISSTLFRIGIQNGVHRAVKNGL